MDCRQIEARGKQRCQQPFPEWGKRVEGTNGSTGANGVLKSAAPRSESRPCAGGDNGC
jgi:hypothetical protein